MIKVRIFEILLSWHAHFRHFKKYIIFPLFLKLKGLPKFYYICPYKMYIKTLKLYAGNLTSINYVLIVTVLFYTYQTNFEYSDPDTTQRLFSRFIFSYLNWKVWMIVLSQCFRATIGPMLIFLLLKFNYFFQS